MSTTTPGRAPAPAPQEAANRPADDALPRLRQQINHAALNRVPDPVHVDRWTVRATRQVQHAIDEVGDRVVRVAEAVPWLPEVTDRNGQIVQFVMVWLVGVLLALSVHALWWSSGG